MHKGKLFSLTNNFKRELEALVHTYCQALEKEEPNATQWKAFHLISYAAVDEVLGVLIHRVDEYDKEQEKTCGELEECTGATT